jgi:Neuraminidase (sialidase)
VTLYSTKQSISNTTLANAKSGDVAVIKVDTGQFAENGHVAIIRSINNNPNGTVSLTIEEGGYICRKTGCLDTRTATAQTLADAEKELKITGIYRP